MTEAYFFGLRIVFVFMAIAVEYYFLALDRYTEGEIGGIQFGLLSAVAAGSFLLHVQNIKNSSAGLLPVILIPSAHFIFDFAGKLWWNRMDNYRACREINLLKKSIEKNPGMAPLYMALGDVYSKQGNCEEALSCYKKGHKLEATPGSLQKIKIASREVELKKGERWVCRECRADNPKDTDRCRECGTSRSAMAYLKEDLESNKNEIKKWIIKGFSIPVALLLIIGLLKLWLPSTGYTILAAIIAMAIVVLVLKKFFSW